jgi:isopentenyldiphosphate isomerase
LNKDSYPGCYDISSAGHIPAGNGFLESALRELKEELGVAADADELIYCGQRQFEFRETFHELEFWDRQISNVYVLWLDKEAAEFAIQRSEVAAVMWMDWDMCLDMVKNRKAPNCIWIKELEMISPAVKSSYLARP